MGQGKSQFTEEELQDYQVCMIIKCFIYSVKQFTLETQYFSGSHIFYKKGGLIVSIEECQKISNNKHTCFIIYIFIYLIHFLTCLQNVWLFDFFSAHQKFKALAPEKVGHNKNAKLPMAKVLQYPELSVNPFGERICKIFSSSQDGDCTFEDFLDMMSVFSQSAPKSVKAEHAFRIFGKYNL